LEVYESQTKPLIDYYTVQGKIRPVDGVGEIKEIFGRVTQVLS
jgi:adenylate kinase